MAARSFWWCTAAGILLAMNASIALVCDEKKKIARVATSILAGGRQMMILQNESSTLNKQSLAYSCLHSLDDTYVMFNAQCPMLSSQHEEEGGAREDDLADVALTTSYNAIISERA